MATRPSSHTFLAAVVVVAACGGLASQTSPSRLRGSPTSANEWPMHLHDAAGTRFSPLTQITPDNVAELHVAWVYHMKPPALAGRADMPQASDVRPPAGAPSGGRGRGRGFGSGTGFAQSEVTPIVADGMMFITTPYGGIVALDPTTGKELWVFSQPLVAQGSTRGLEFWPGDADHTPRVVYHGGGGLVELDARTGEPIAGFGRNGVLAPADGASVGSASSPPVIYRNIIISQSANPNRNGRNSDIHAFDVVTGKQLWRFATIPAKGEPGYETWAPGSAERQTSVHVWGLMTLDTQRGILYATTNAPEWNRYGGDRHGDNLYSSTLLALDVATGKLRWYFQLVRHDIWDLDGSAPPVLVDVKRGNRTIPAVAASSKAGLLFLLDRVTGKPIYGVEERPVASSEIPEEKTSPTQPFPVRPPPLGRQTVSMEDIATVTPELQEYCTDLITKYRATMGGPYLPPGLNHPSINFPGPNASTNWGGGAYDPRLGYLIINSQDLGQLTEMGLRGKPRDLTIGVAGAGSGSNPNIPYDMAGVNGRFKDPDLNMMCQQPPWGSLTAVDVNTGEFAWRVPLGVTDSLPVDKQKTGRPNSGGPIVTASGLVFIGATDDLRFRAFDARSGKELWVEKLPASSHSVPITYMGRDGKQYVVFPATGGSLLQDAALSDSLFAYALK